MTKLASGGDRQPSLLASYVAPRRGGVDPVQLYVSIAGLSYFYLSNSYTLCAIFGRDLLSTKAKSERLSHMCDVILGYVLRS